MFGVYYFPSIYNLADVNTRERITSYTPKRRKEGVNPWETKNNITEVGRNWVGLQVTARCVLNMRHLAHVM